MAALPAPSYGGGAGWRQDEHLVDALPYIDPLAQDVKRRVEALVEDEMRASAQRPADYLRGLPPLPAMHFEGHPMLDAEYERVRAKRDMPALDTSRYQLAPPPAERAGDLAAWRAAVGNARAQLEHQHNRVQNLELALRYGPSTWRVQNQLNEALLAQQDAELGAVRRSTDALNRDRKLQQNAAGLELRRLEDEWAALVRKNVEIGAACDRLQAEVERLGGGAALAAAREG